MTPRTTAQTPFGELLDLLLRRREMCRGSLDLVTVTSADGHSVTLDRSTVSKYCNGKKSIPEHVADGIARHLRASPDERHDLIVAAKLSKLRPDIDLMWQVARLLRHRRRLLQDGPGGYTA